MTEMCTTLSVQVASITSYLIDVKEEIFNREFKTSVFDSLENTPEAKIIRSLCNHTERPDPLQRIHTIPHAHRSTVQSQYKPVTGVENMVISYKKLWVILEQRRITKKELCRRADVSMSSI